MNTPPREQADTSKNVAKNQKCKLAYQQMPPDKKAALLQQHRPEYFAHFPIPPHFPTFSTFPNQ